MRQMEGGSKVVKYHQTATRLPIFLYYIFADPVLRVFMADQNLRCC